jgi:hypothetical protein
MIASMSELRETVDDQPPSGPIDVARVKELSALADAKAFDPSTPTYNPTDHTPPRREARPPTPGLDNPVLLDLSARVHAASADRFHPRVGGETSGQRHAPEGSPLAAAEVVEGPIEDEFGPIDRERHDQVPCVVQRSLRVYELDSSDVALSEKDAAAIKEAEQVFAEALDEADGMLSAEELHDLLVYVNPTRASYNCVECAMAVDDLLRGRPAAAGPTRDQSQHYLDAAMEARQLEYVEQLDSDDIERLLLEAGPGARGIVIGWKNANKAHAYNAVNLDGDVYWLDGQKNVMAEQNPHSYKTFDIYRTG